MLSDGLVAQSRHPFCTLARAYNAQDFVTCPHHIAHLRTAGPYVEADRAAEDSGRRARALDGLGVREENIRAGAERRQDLLLCWHRVARSNFSNASRGITRRLEDTTGILEESLTFMEIRSGDECTSIHPFALLSDHIERELGHNPASLGFDVQACATHFLRTVESQTHPMVQLCAGTDTLVIPISIYGDGAQVTEAPLEDTSYVVHIAFLHNDMNELSLPLSKHVYTVYRKKDNAKDTFDDVCRVLVWTWAAASPWRGRKTI